MEHNYENMHLEGNLKEVREMVHNQRPIKRNILGNLVGAFMTIAIGAALIGEITRSLRKNGVM